MKIKIKEIGIVKGPKCNRNNCKSTEYMKQETLTCNGIKAFRIPQLKCITCKTVYNTGRTLILKECPLETEDKPTP